MNSLQIKAALAGVFFGLWPLFMNRSKMTGNVSSAFFSLIVFVCVLPFALGGLKSMDGINWKMVAAAGIAGAIGVLFFNGMLAKATKENVGMLFVIMIVVQTTIPAMNYAIMNGGMSPSKIIGFVMAFTAAILLTR
jgi:hypothetical protein